VVPAVAAYGSAKASQEVQFSVRHGGTGMRTVNFTQLRQNLAAELDCITDDAEELVVTRSGHEPVVIVPLAEYESMKEPSICSAARLTPRHCAGRSPSWTAARASNGP
jgi:prevent-host-death family protein